VKDKKSLLIHEVWFWQVAPKLFQQMYSIHGTVRGKTVPLVSALLPNKQQTTYEELFRIVDQRVTNKPKHITIDFEKGAENALGTIFPRSQIFGCFFHFKQAIWRNICVSELK
jgi:hypothetical protein